MTSGAQRPLRILHVVYRFDIGGLENVIVQLINGLPRDGFVHVVLSLTKVTDFRLRVERDDVEFVALDKPPGHAIALYPRILRLMRQWRPDVVHTCNLAALEVMPLAWLAGVRVRVHAEHGWDVTDPAGTSSKNRMIRKLYRPFVSHYVAVSQDLLRYLTGPVGIAGKRVSLIPNGVDTRLFAPRKALSGIPGCPFDPARCRLIGTVGRLQEIKNQVALARAFVALLNRYPSAREDMRLVIVGEGPYRAQIEQVLIDGGVADLAWLPGARNDVAAILPHLYCFVLPSLAEGTSCTLLEAMACAVPVVATAVGGTPALVDEGVTGWLVPANDVEALAAALGRYYEHAEDAVRDGARGRERIAVQYALDGMVSRYAELFSKTSG